MTPEHQEPELEDPVGMSAVDTRDDWPVATNTRMQIPPAGWRARSACTSADHDLFIAEVDSDQKAQAKAICERCQVRDACLAFSIAHGIQYGVWGGLDAQERQRVRRIWSKQREFGVAGRVQQTA